MTLLAAENISKKFRDQVILDSVSFTLEQGERIALVGHNGIGKTTLLELLAGKQRPDSGRITRSRQCLIEYVEQDKSDFLQMTLFDFVADARADLLAMRHEIERLEKHLAACPTDAAGLERLGSQQQEYERLDGFSLDSRVEAILSGLGFERERFDEQLDNFSGGERNRAGLARLLAGRGNLLLLDEPTNHLDIQSTAWLEEYLKAQERAVLVVSHDRAFLDACADRIWEMEAGQLEKYTGGMRRFLRERQSRRDLAGHRYRHQQEEIKRIEEFVRRNMAGQKTKQAQSRLKYLDRIKRLPPPKTDGRGPTIKMESSGRSFAHVLSVEAVSLGYDDRVVLAEVAFDLYRGDKVGLIGRNGSGKSTLLKALIGELVPLAGYLKLGTNVNVAYFDQDLSDLDETATVLDNIWQVDPFAEPGPLRSFLARFGFTGEDAFKKVSALSGGERTKVCLARLLYRPANLMILDEPTNHLDLEAREALESALQNYPGSALIVSHDRYFLDQVVDKIMVFEQGRVRSVTGNYSDYLAQTALPVPVAKTKNSRQKQDYLQFKEKSRQRSRLKKNIEQTRAELERRESELKAAETELAATDRTADWEHLHSLAESIKRMEDEILNLGVKLEELEGIELD